MLKKPTQSMYKNKLNVKYNKRKEEVKESKDQKVRQMEKKKIIIMAL